MFNWQIQRRINSFSLSLHTTFYSLQLINRHRPNTRLLYKANDPKLFWVGITLSIDKIGGLENKLQPAVLFAHRQVRCFYECVSENEYMGHTASNQTNPHTSTGAVTNNKLSVCGQKSDFTISKYF